MVKLFRFLKPFRIHVLMVLLLIFLQSMSSLYLPTLMAHIVDNGVVKGNVPYIWRVGGFMLLVAVAGVFCSVGASYMSSTAAAGFGRILRSRVFHHVEQFTLHEFDKLGTASMITRTTNDITQVQQLLNMMLRLLVMAPLMSIGGIIMAVYTDAKLSLIIVVVVPLLGLAILMIFRQGMALFRAMQTKIDRLNRVLREGLTGIRVIRSFNRIEYEKTRFDEANWDLTDTAIRVNQIMASMQPIMMLILNFSTIAIVWFGGIRISNGQMQIGSLMAFIQYAMQILFSVMMVSMMFFMVPRAAASATRINEILEIDPEITDANLVQRADQQHGVVQFDNVTFHYPGAEQPALSAASFCTRPGEVTAIIGGTGSGKSTLVNLIPRFYDVTEGTVLVDGVDVREQAQVHLREKMGYIPQQAMLFSGTIAENIRFGAAGASDADVRQAADIAQATEFIEGLHDGFNAVITQGGTNLSGGQKQRLSIARALACRPEIFIFDDSFSALDFKTDAKLREALRSVTSNATVLIVAQRVTTVMDADQIVVLDEGRVAGIGRHKELMESCEVYREIVSSQLSEEEIA